MTRADKQVVGGDDDPVVETWDEETAPATPRGAARISERAAAAEVAGVNPVYAPPEAVGVQAPVPHQAPPGEAGRRHGPQPAAAVEALRAGQLVPASSIVAAPDKVRFPTAALAGVAPGQVDVGEPASNKVVATVRNIQGEQVPLTQHGVDVVTGMQRRGFKAIAFGNRKTRKAEARAAQVAAELKAYKERKAGVAVPRTREEAEAQAGLERDARMARAAGERKAREERVARTASVTKTREAVGYTKLGRDTLATKAAAAHEARGVRATQVAAELKARGRG